MRIFQTKSLLFGSSLQGLGLGSHTAGSKSSPANQRTVRVTDHKPRATSRVTRPRRLPSPPPTSPPCHLELWPQAALPGQHAPGHPPARSSTSGSGDPARETHRHASSLTATPQPQGPENTLFPRADRSTLRCPTGGGRQNLSRRHRS